MGSGVKQSGQVTVKWEAWAQGHCTISQYVGDAKLPSHQGLTKKWQSWNPEWKTITNLGENLVQKNVKRDRQTN